MKERLLVILHFHLFHSSLAIFVAYTIFTLLEFIVFMSYSESTVSQFF